MAKKEEKKVVEEDIVVKADNPFDFENLEYVNIEEDKKQEVFENLKKANQTLMLMIKEAEKQMTALEAKAQGKVSEDTYLRLVADYDNFKRRNASARSEGYADGQEEVLSSFVEVVDNFERAIPMIEDEKVLSGINMIYKQFIDKLKGFDVVEIQALGNAFDPELMNAVMQSEAESKDQEDTVTEVFQKGYVKGKKVLRHAYVKVAK